MNIKNQEQFVVEKTMTLDEYVSHQLSQNKNLSSSYADKVLDNLIYGFNTDLFGKSTRTTVCFNGKNDSKVMFCENCGKTHIDNMVINVEIGKKLVFKPAIEEWEKDEYEYIPSERIKSITCGDCSAEYNYEDVKRIARKSKHELPNTVFVYKTIFEDDNLIKLSFKTSNIFVEKGFYSEDNRYKITFNTDTGLTYLFNCPTNNKNREKLFHVNSSLLNITYNSSEVDYALSNIHIDESNEESTVVYSFKEIHGKINKKLSNKFMCNLPTLRDYANELNLEISDEDMYTVKNIALYNRFPKINTFKLKYMFNLEKAYQERIPRKINKISQSSDLNEFINQVGILYKVSNTEILSSYINNYDRFKSKTFKEALFYLSLFSDKKYLLNLLNNEHLGENYYDNDIFNSAMKKKNNRYSADLMLLKDIASDLGEDCLYSILSKCLVDYDLKSHLYNIKEMYYDIKSVDSRCQFDLNEVYSLIMKFVTSDEVENYRDRADFNQNIKDEIKESLYSKMSQYQYKRLNRFYKFNIKTMDEHFEEYSNHMNRISEQIISAQKVRRFNGVKLIKNNLIAMKIYAINPTENPYKLLDMFGIGNQNNIKEIPIFFKTLDKKSTNVLGDILKYYNIPSTKYIRKSLEDNYSNLKVLAYYSRLFTDVNILNNIIKNKLYHEVPEIVSFANLFNSDNNKFAVDVYDVYETSNSHDLIHIRDKYVFLKDMLYTKGEAELGRKLIGSKNSGITSIIGDIANMYKAYKELYEDEKFDFNGSMKDIHDRLIDLTGSVNRPFKKSDFEAFKYSKEQKKLAFEKDEYSFVLPENGKDLVIVGRELKNCVGGYVGSVRAKKCTIVYVKYQDEYKICIELKVKDSKYYINQAKLYANSSLGNDLNALAVVREWMDKNDISDESGDLVPVSHNIRQLNNIGNRDNRNNDYTEGDAIRDEFGYLVEAIPF